MDLIPHFSSEVCDVFLEREVNCVYFHWKETAHGYFFREAMEKGLELIREMHLEKWLADTSRFGQVEEADIQWIHDHYSPRNSAAGMRWMAFVIPSSQFNALTVADGAMEAENLGIVTRYFQEVEATREWLASVD